jgi:hypothetical protein
MVGLARCSDENNMERRETRVQDTMAHIESHGDVNRDASSEHVSIEDHG